jgi:hypothetical protein
MKIELDIPDWCEKENLYLIHRNELIAFKVVGRDWEVKKIRCNKCGRCCMVHPKKGAYFPLKEDGSCIHLVKDGKFFICCLGMEKPLACVLGEPEGKEHEQFKCSIEY